MPLNSADVVRIIANQSYLGQLMQNVFFYRAGTLPTPPEGETLYQYALSRFNAQWGIPVRAQQHTDCNHLFYRIENLTNGVDFAELQINTAGAVSGDPAPSFQAINLTLQRSSLLTRNGSKRMGGLPESATTGNLVNWAGGTYTAIQDAFGKPLLDSLGDDDPWLFPCIVGRTLVENDEGEFVYELDLTKINLITGAVITEPSTQRSRKAGRGV